MITLKDSVTINTTLEKLYNWLINLDENFVKWHPNYVKFEKLTGSMDVGDWIYFEENVNGTIYKIKGKITRKEINKNGFRVDFKTNSGLGHITFMAEATESGCVFTHIESFGLETPIIGNIINFIIFRVLVRKKANWDLISQDMKEDNVNLKRILETGQY
ncbi:SRPBCC family protein [Methanobacterium ferruginis]|uniref:SRPBCC family protein n=1 Tax=Methanobacterium ferruginis TaxID=710191 RepID=UPI00257242E9|nr:SRPBCC family protein [Methanobacterium ferruginis]BDZ68120.1 SRPBCC family protein [Methanobacterium ferruginis]